MMLWHHMDRLKPEADNLIHIYVRECCKLGVISEVIGKLLSGAKYF